MSLKHGILGFLSEGQMSGYDLEGRFKQSVGHFWNAKISQIYRDLHTMEKTGWVECTEVVGKGTLNKKLYTITARGRQELKNWLSEYSLDKDFTIRMGILMRMYFAMLVPVEETIELLEQFKTGCKKQLEGLSLAPKQLAAFEEDYKKEVFYIKTTLSYGEKYYQMQLDWCNETIEKIKEADFLHGGIDDGL